MAATTAICLLALVLGVWSTGYSQSIDSALLNAGSKDGELVWYTMESTHIVEALRKKFEEQIPSIRLKTFRSRSSEIANRISAEAKAERHEFDVATINPITAYALKSRRLIKQHLPKRLKSSFQPSEILMVTGIRPFSRPMLLGTTRNSFRFHQRRLMNSLRQSGKAKWG